MADRFKSKSLEILNGGRKAEVPINIVAETDIGTVSTAYHRFHVMSSFRYNTAVFRPYVVQQ